MMIFTDAITRMAVSRQALVASIREIDEISYQNACEAQTVSAATLQQSASMEEMSSLSQKLANILQTAAATRRTMTRWPQSVSLRQPYLCFRPSIREHRLVRT